MTTSKLLSGQEQLPLFSQEAFPVSPFPVPGNEKARKMTVTSGLKCLELLPKSSQSGASLKMLEDCLVLKGGWFSRICYLNWKPLVTKQGRLLYQLVPKTPRTEGTGCGFALTPSTVNMEPSEDRLEKRTAYRESIGRHYVPGGLSEQIAMLPTPSVKDVSGGAVEAIPTAAGFKRVSKQGVSHGAQLHDVMKLIGTPKAQDSRAALSDRGKCNMGEQVQGATGLKLQPAFVEYLMGYPDGWTDLKD